ncbi:MAG TPA: glycosyltransferase family 2 protein [Alphaproteobacteria bacterium]|nr:glycosyltransferase family 2 protein [Alphaproteobacteria bacterium]
MSVPSAMTVPNAKREAVLAILCLVVTLTLYAMLFDRSVHKVYDSFFFPNLTPFYGGLVFLVALGLVLYAALLYNVCLVGNYLRQLRERIPEAAEVETIFDAPAPALTVLIPSYKEERFVIWQTMLSAAVSEYPQKRVVLLIDNPPNPSLEEDRVQLAVTRALPSELQAEFDREAVQYRSAHADYLARAAAGNMNAAEEQARIAALYESAAAWFDAQVRLVAGDTPVPELAFDVRFFVEKILMVPAANHRARAVACRNETLSPERIAHHYAHLAALFNVEFSSFERKRYVNLSHDANKAMNLNSYIQLIGHAWREVETPQGLTLQACAEEDAHFTVPYADYINTIDADSLMTHDYVSRLVYFLERPEHAKVAVAQAPCSSIPGSPVPIERIAGAVIDVQYHTHQGYTYWYASFWVGANAMLRMTALNAIKEVSTEAGKTITVYIQDRTVIEDTESTIDLVQKGWLLYNYPGRMTFSATPADFGSLLIQRRRWANGGLIILPKLLRYAIRAPKNLRLLKELFMRFNYLAMTTLSVAVMYLFAFYSFSPRLSTPLLIYANIPLLFLYARDLKVCGYRYTDVFRVVSLNLMLLPIITAGVLKQLQQIITGRKVPFARTPKVKNRTGAPALYYMMELGMIGYCIYMAATNALDAEWTPVAYAGINLTLLLYAMFRYIGVRNMLQDLAAAWRETRLNLIQKRPFKQLRG